MGLEFCDNLMNILNSQKTVEKLTQKGMNIY